MKMSEIYTDNQSNLQSIDKAAIMNLSQILDGSFMSEYIEEGSDDGINSNLMK